MIASLSINKNNLSNFLQNKVGLAENQRRKIMSIIYGNDRLVSSKSERKFNQRLLAISRCQTVSNMVSNSETFDDFFVASKE